ncbi:hypothetical protein TWF730_008922 [Orbilia blumenaviensis]|uniref:Uncharacterized protein n=1 Tax=Orbilia blumenaviensis TaxID=1796055 RepID=A0AAV9UWW7_9PEZI
MKINIFFAVLAANVWVASATVQWKDSVSRFSTDLLRKKHRDQQVEKFSTVMNRLKPALGKDPTDYPLFVELPLDHFGANNNETIKCRYFVQEAYYKPGGPVIFHDIGEASIGPHAKGLVDEDEFSVAMAKRFNGLLILFEHRFYGQSAPITSVSKDLSKATRRELTQFFKYHTIEQALEDVVYFAKNFTYDLEEYPKQALTPDKTPWVWVGVSYSGARGAWITKRNPGLFKATLASSAPVQLKVNFWEYFTAIEDALLINNKNCSSDLRAAAKWLSDAWDNRDHNLVDQLIDAVYEKDWEETLEQFTPEAEDVWDIRKDYLQDAAWTPFADFQYFGVNGGTLGLFCDIMETAYSDSGEAEGVFESQSLERAVRAYAKAVAAISPYSYTVRSQQRSQRKDKAKRQLSTGTLDDRLDDYSWLWQVCSEFGAFQVANTSRVENLIPSFIDVQSQIDSCISTFGISDQVSEAGPNVDPINEKYRGWYLELSNTLWTNGEFDPWRALSIDSEEEGAPTNDTSTLEIPRCGDTFPAGTQLRYVIKDGFHGSEFSEDVGTETPGFEEPEPSNTLRSPTSTRTRTRTSMTGTPVVDATNAQNLWFSAMSSWLPCTTLRFNPKGAVAETTTAAPSTSESVTQTGTLDGASATGGSGENTPQGKNAGASLVIPSMMIPFFVSIVAFLAGIRAVV